jgi:hypothetical protein
VSEQVDGTDRVPAGIAPGCVYVRLVADSGEVIGEHVLTVASAALMAHVDADMLERWMSEHPKDVTRAYTYDGDTGALTATMVIPGKCDE